YHRYSEYVSVRRAHGGAVYLEHRRSLDSPPRPAPGPPGTKGTMTGDMKYAVTIAPVDLHPSADPHPAVGRRQIAAHCVSRGSASGTSVVSSWISVLRGCNVSMRPPDPHPAAERRQIGAH